MREDVDFVLLQKRVGNIEKAVRGEGNNGSIVKRIRTVESAVDAMRVWFRLIGFVGALVATLVVTDVVQRWTSSYTDEASKDRDQLQKQLSRIETRLESMEKR